ncbi:MAG: tRNA 2-thiouridine(34) synthase MnmA [Candidatus Paceibacterota bacterium]|jgi:tRNA-specific 2-thiouridylase
MTTNQKRNKKTCPERYRRVVVGMSGGVDSSVALLLLKKQGWEPIGVTLKLPVWENKKNLLRENVCCTTESMNVAKLICKKLDIPYFIIDCQKDFTKKIVNYFVSELKNNRTPNPCVVCNRDFKFQKLFEVAKKMGANYVATGHYTRIRIRELKIKNALPTGRQAECRKFELLIAKDTKKDQSYMLSGLSQKDLAKIILPLGDLTKKDVYKIAKRESCLPEGRGFKFFEKIRQSQDFCFVSGKSLPAFLKQKIGEKPGNIINENGKIIGQHKGRHFFTLGQRKGINISNGPYFVFGFDKKKNVVYATKDKNKLFKKEILLSPYHLISGEKLKKPINVLAKTRYHQELFPAKIIPQGKKLKLIFKKPVFSPTPGQFAVFYDKNVCLGNGVII